MPRRVSTTFSDETFDDLFACAGYRFGAGHASVSEYVKLAAIQLMRRDIQMVRKEQGRGNVSLDAEDR